MYYFYSIQHLTTKLLCLSISSTDPRSIDGFKGPSGRWRKHIKRNGWSKKNLKITVLHESHDLNVIKQWKNYYYDCWNVLDNPKFIHSRYKKTKVSIRADKHPMYGKSAVKAHNLRWYTDGISKNVFVTEGTQPKGYVLGRKINYQHAITLDGKARISKAQSRACVDPNGVKYKSLREAAKAYGVSARVILYRIQKGNGWNYLHKSL
jgi:hypothetical protein